MGGSFKRKTSVKTFNELTLSPSLMKGIQDLGFETPSPIQAQTLPILLGEPTDFLGLAATGTGKTAAFAIPLLEKTDPTKRAVQTLVLVPTRELAIQVTEQVNLLAKHMKMQALVIYGGAGYADQIQGLRRGATVVVGTPGRILDHIERGTLKLDAVERIVLDEADEMISMGFKDDLEKILAATQRETTNIWLFSATMSREVRRVADIYLNQPQQVQVNKTEMLPSNVEQIYYITHESNKPEILCKLIDSVDDIYALVFCQTKSLVSEVTQFLKDRNYKVECLHGDMSQAAREQTIKIFRDRKVQLVVCTDVASRGLDVKDITHVINYSIPRELDSYVHRIGRTARSGKSGVAMSLVTPANRVLIPKIEQMTKRRMQEGRIPTRREIGARKIAKVLTTFQNQPTFPLAAELMGDLWKEAVAKMTPEEIAARFLTMTFSEVFAGRDEAPIRFSEPVERSRNPGKRSNADHGRSQDNRFSRFGRNKRFDRKRDFKRA